MLGEVVMPKVMGSELGRVCFYYALYFYTAFLLLISFNGLPSLNLSLNKSFAVFNCLTNEYTQQQAYSATKTVK